MHMACNFAFEKNFKHLNTFNASVLKISAGRRPTSDLTGLK